MPAKPGESERLMTMTLRAFHTSSTGMPAIGLPGVSLAAGLTTSLAPTTMATSVFLSSALDGSSSISSS